MIETVVAKPLHRAIKYRAMPNLEAKKKIDECFRRCQTIFNALLDANEQSKKEGKGDLDSRALSSLAQKEGKKIEGFNASIGYYIASKLYLSIKRSQREGEGEVRKKTVGEPRASFTFSCKKPLFKEAGNKRRKQCAVFVPGIGDILIVKHREFPFGAKFTIMSVSRNPSGQYFISIGYEIAQENKPIPPIKNPLGLDFSVPKLYVSSEKDFAPDIELLKIRKRFAAKVALAHKRLSRCKKGSNNYEKARIKLARIYQKMDNIRTDYIHKETNRLAKTYDFIGAETLSLKEMGERFHFYKALFDNSWFIFISTLKYKMEAERKQIRFVSRFYPSSKTCHRCGYINHDLTLADREYDCPNCHAKSDRDINAAKNIRDQALRDAGYRIHYIQKAEEAKPKESEIHKKENGHPEKKKPAIESEKANEAAIRPCPANLVQPSSIPKASSPGARIPPVKSASDRVPVAAKIEKTVADSLPNAMTLAKKEEIAPTAIAKPDNFMDHLENIYGAEMTPDWVKKRRKKS